jgi:opacity protein-like surface antigen
MGSWSVTPGVSVTKLRQETLSAFSLSLAKSFGALSLWVSGKYGPEYRAAYLSQFALLNSEDRSVWSLSAGLRAALNEGWSLVVGYLFLNMRTPDSLAARMHLVNVSVVYSF